MLGLKLNYVSKKDQDGIKQNTVWLSLSYTQNFCMPIDVNVLDDLIPWKYLTFEKTIFLNIIHGSHSLWINIYSDHTGDTDDVGSKIGRFKPRRSW